MKLRFTLLAAAAAMLLSAQAEPLTFQMGGNDGAVILNNGKFNPLGSFIGNTSGNQGEESVIQVGEVDFGTGDAYKAVSLRFANGWSNGGTAILLAGADYESATAFAAIPLINFHDSYTNFRSIGANFSDQPTGVQKVFLTFADRAGNVQDVRFYENAFVETDFENGSMLKEPCMLDNYSEVGTILDINNSTLVVPANNDTRIDNGSWGWTGTGCVVSYGEMDFGNGEYNQVVLELASHWQGDQTSHNVMVYLDDYENEANCIATVWCGIDVKTKLYLARNIEAVTGTHTVYLKWQDGSNNIANVHFAKGHVWSLGNILDPIVTTYENEQPSDKAVRYSFLDGMKNSEEATYIGKDSGRTTILYKGQWETDNVGYTGDGSVLKITGMDFQQGQFDKILVSHATGMSWAGYINEANFKFYIDLEANPTAVEGAPRRIEVADWSQVRNQLTDIEPIATVRLQATSGWGNVYTTKGDLSKVEGVHDVYVVYTAPDGANIKDIYLDDQEEDPATGVTSVTAAKAVNGNVYTIDGRMVRSNAAGIEGLPAGLYIFNGQKYIVK
ncbi:MAG: carbohydrate-binding protein [Muribaculaceae bacterium]|nr:carbohydrate-binding protein [Muribaculaceae bacterium]